MYGTTLRLPGEFFDNTRDDTTMEPAAYVTQLKSDMQWLQATPVRQQAPRKVHVHSDLLTCTHVFVRHDANQKALKAPYDGPYLSDLQCISHWMLKESKNRFHWIASNQHILSSQVNKVRILPYTLLLPPNLYQNLMLAWDLLIQDAVSNGQNVSCQPFTSSLEGEYCSGTWSACDGHVTVTTCWTKLF